MSNQTTVIAALAAIGLAACGALSVIEPAKEEGPTTISARGASRLDPFRPVRSDVERGMPPAAPGGAGPRMETEVGARAGVQSMPDQRGELLGDRIALEILGPELGVALGLEYRHASRRNVIEHVIQGDFGVGVVVTEPSRQERRLGARDIILGEFQLALAVHPQNPTRCLPLREAQSMLSGRRSVWPRSGRELRIAGPAAKSRAAMFAELLVPGDPLAITAKLDDPARVLALVRRDRDAIGIVPRATLLAAREQGVAEFVIPGFRPTKTLRLVFRDMHDPACAAVLDFCRSAEAHEMLGQRLVLR